MTDPATEHRLSDAELLEIADSSPLAFAHFCLYDPRWDREQCERVLAAMYDRTVDQARAILERET